MIARELTMTLMCKMCSNQYGAWRPRCPTCGELTPVTASAAAPRVNRPRLVVSHERKQDECILCRRRKAKDRCPHCNEAIHRNCLGVHKDDCEKFQVERAAEIARVSA